MGKSPEAFRTISEVAKELSVPKHVLRFWEGKFNHLKPMKRGGGRRYYRPEDVDLLRGIRQLLYEDGYTIKGVQRIFREQGPRYVMDCWSPTEDGASLMPQEIPDLALEAAQKAAHPTVQTTGPALGESAPQSEGREIGLSETQVQLLTGVLAEVEACRRLLKND